MESLPPVIIRFADAYLSSLEELQGLTLCMEHRERWLDAPAVAEMLGIPRRTSRGALDHLAGCNLLDIRISGELRYRFRPGTPELEAQAVAFFAAYRRTPLHVLALIGGDVGQTARDVAGSKLERRNGR